MAAPPKKRSELHEQAQIQAYGKTMVYRFAMLMKTVRIHSVGNSALQYSIKLLVDAMQDIFVRIGDYRMKGDNDSVFINEMRIKPEVLMYDAVVNLLAELQARGVGGMAVTGTINQMQCRTMMQLLMDNPTFHEDDEGAEILNGLLEAQGIYQLRFLKAQSLVTQDEQAGRGGPGGEGDGEGQGPGEAGPESSIYRSIQAYVNLLVIWKTYLTIDGDRVPDLIRRRLLQAVQQGVDTMFEYPMTFLSLAAFRRPSEHRVVHSVNVAVLAMGIGQRMELGRKTLMNLAMSALYADSGARRFPDDVRFGPMMESKQERDAWARHPLDSVKEILQTPALTRAQRDRIMVAYEHHLGHDGSGFPRRIEGKGLHLFSEIVALADRFCELTSDRATESAICPSKALEQMSVLEDERYDSRLLRVFVHMMTPFPVGTLVELSTGELAVVYRHHADPDLKFKPLVRVVRTAEGERIRPVLFNLAEAAVGYTAPTIVGSLPPNTMQVLPSELLFGNGPPRRGEVQPE